MEYTIIQIIISSIAILSIGLYLYILYENRHFHITTYEYRNSKLPKAFDGCKVIFLTDLHNYCYGKGNERLIKAIESQHPDYILIGGDMIVKGIDFDGKVALDLLGRLASKYPVYYAFGNHELRLSVLPETKDSTFVEYIDTLKSYGVQFLLNDKISLTKGKESIELYGLNLSEYYYEKCRKNPLTKEELAKLLGELDPDKFSILLAHNPLYFPEYASFGADLVLSGHVHGGIIALPVLGGVVSTQLRLFPKYDFGKFENQDSTMILSRGLGNHTIHIRINNRAELINVILQSK